jgi:hypothetical protein
MLSALRFSPCRLGSLFFLLIPGKALNRTTIARFLNLYHRGLQGIAHLGNALVVRLENLQADLCAHAAGDTFYGNLPESWEMNSEKRNPLAFSFNLLMRKRSQIGFKALICEGSEREATNLSNL